MIRSFRHRGLKRFFDEDDRRGVPAAHADRIGRILDRLHAALRPEDMALPGYRFHPLKGAMKGRFAVSVSGNWRITYAFAGENAIDVDLEDYH